MEIEKRIEKLFHDLLSLLRIYPSEDLFTFENGRLKPYQSRSEFTFHLTNFYDEVLSKVSNSNSYTLQRKISEKFEEFITNLNILLPRILKLV